MLDRILSFDTMWWLLLIVYVPACIGLIVIVLLQKGKGTGFGGAFGAGAGPGSDTVFGASSAMNLPVRLTYAAAAVFMLIAVVMSIISGGVGKGSAPEMVEGVSGQIAVGSTALDDLGLGSKTIDGANQDKTSATPEASNGAVDTPEESVEAAPDASAAESADVEQ